MAAKPILKTWLLVGTVMGIGAHQNVDECINQEDSCLASVEIDAEGEIGKSKDHAMLSTRSSRGLMQTACTNADGDPYSAGYYIDCCSGSKKTLVGSAYKCIPSACTQANADPYSTGNHIECCAGLTATVKNWNGDGRYYFKCIGSPTPTPTPTPTPPTPVPTPTPTPANDQVAAQGTGMASTFKVMEWNVYYQNKDYTGMANTLMANKPVADIIGLCEFTGSMSEMAYAFSTSSGKKYKEQPGRSGWVGYGTDMFYDSTRWTALDGGVSKTSTCGSRGGDRAANWLVLQEIDSGNKIIVGGTHLSYCAGGCDDVHACELKQMYAHFDQMKTKYNAPVIWMGDLNRQVYDSIVKKAMSGEVGSFALDDLAQSTSQTHKEGGVIDHIMGEKGYFKIKSGQHGTTGQGVKYQNLAGSDHFPVYSVVTYMR
mmetsp:Transcript_55175/g.117706  ORF Transcript_55175/g.117706 Transcript_55175/m.117706 type:complete len:428 (+) Transcript_55175:249-1532(+)